MNNLKYIIKKKYFFIFSIALTFITISCEERIDLESKNGRNIVVNAIITDRLVDQKIKLSYSEVITGRYNYNPVYDAKVKIIDFNKNVYEFVELEHGIYISKYPFKAEENISYSLLITLEDGTVINSNLEALPEKVKMEANNLSFYNFITKEKIVADKDPVNTTYFSANMDFKFNKTLKNGPFISINYSGIYELKPKELNSCSNGGIGYILSDVGGINFNKFSLLNFNSKLNAPNQAIFLDTELKSKYHENYVIFMNFLMINEGYYNYLKNSKDLIENTGGLFDKSPGKLISNLSSSNNFNTQGYFAVVRTKRKAIRISHSNFEYTFYRTCDPSRLGNPPRGESFCHKCDNIFGDRVIRVAYSGWMEDDGLINRDGWYYLY